MMGFIGGETERGHWTKVEDSGEGDTPLQWISAEILEYSGANLGSRQEETGLSINKQLKMEG